MDRSIPTPEAERQAGNSQSRKVRGNLSPREGILHQTVSRPSVANQVFWDPGWLTSARRVAVRDQLPRRDTSEMALLQCTQETGAGTREVIRCTTQLGECACQAPGRLRCSDLGRAQNAGPAESVPLWSTQVPEPE